ncbi:MAG: hypothetical protein IPO27_12825 [Bacteroidetes bacterium]|nr:hypothetical protein [Bacteroidota bacterium]
MESNSSAGSRLDLVSLILVLRKWRKHLAITALVAALAGIIITLPFIMPPQFESTVILYPSNLIPYSTESPTETMLQLLESDDIKDKLITSFSLYEHYKIDRTSKFPRTRIYNQLKEMISISRTAYESVEISVLDENPRTASAICDTMVALLDWKARNLQRTKTSEVVKIFERQVEIKKRELDSLEKIQGELRNTYGILDYKSQSKELSKAMYKGSGASLSKVMEDYNNLKLKGVQAEQVTNAITNGRRVFMDYKVNLERAQSDLTKILTYSNYVTKPLPAENKAKPKRTIIVLSLIIVSIFFALIVILLIENYQQNIKPRLNAQ